jgi:hypothetical protein
MDTQIIVVFCLCDDMLKKLHHHEDKQCKMSDAEVMTTAIVAVLYFKGNLSMASRFLHDTGYIPNMLSKSRFNRRLHRIADLFLTLFLRLGETWKKLNERSTYVIDSFPITSCDNYRIQRSKRHQGELWRGFQSSKKRYFFGLKVHIMVTEHGEPVEFFLTPGSFSDTRALGLYNFDLPEHSWVTGDKAYNNYVIEDILRDTGIQLLPIRKRNEHSWVTGDKAYNNYVIEDILRDTGIQLLPIRKRNQVVEKVGEG